MNREQPRTGYDKVAEDYATTFFDEFARKPFDCDLLVRFLAQHGEGTILDVGCGPGHLARFLADRGGKAQGLDLSPEMVRVAERLNPDLPFGVGDMGAIPFEDGYFTGLAAFYSLIHVPRDQVDQVLKEFWRVLMPGGGVLIAVHGGEGESSSKSSLGTRLRSERRSSRWRSWDLPCEVKGSRSRSWLNGSRMNSNISLLVCMHGE